MKIYIYEKYSVNLDDELIIVACHLNNITRHEKRIRLIAKPIKLYTEVT